MVFIGNIDLLKKDVFAYRVYDKLLSKLKDGDNLLYYMFPVYSGDIDMDKVEATLLQTMYLLLVDYQYYTL